jgi:hypothetical protein
VCVCVGGGCKKLPYIFSSTYLEKYRVTSVLHWTALYEYYFSN